MEENIVKQKASVPSPAPTASGSSSSSSSSELSAVNTDEDTYSAYSDSAATGGDVVDALGEGMTAGVEAGTASGEAAVEAAVTTAVEATEVATAAIPVVDIVCTVVDTIIGITMLALAFVKNETVTVNVTNNTPFNLVFSPDPANEQFYLNHGDMPGYPGPINPNMSPLVQMGTFVFTNAKGSDFGPSGAVWLSVLDPSSDATIAGLCIAYSNPYSSNGENSCAVAFNQQLPSWFKSFNSGPSQLNSVAFVAPAGYPMLYATAGLSSASNSPVTINVALSSLPGLQAANNPTVTTVSPTQIKAAYVDTNNSLWSVSDSNGMWDPSIVLPPGKFPQVGNITGDVAPIQFNNVTHYLFTDNGGNIWDYVPGNGVTNTNTGSDGNGAPRAAGNPHCVVDGADLLHVCYRDASGNVWDTYTNGDSYSAQQLAGSGSNVLTNAPAAACDPVPLYLPSNGTFHVFFIDGSGDLWDLHSDGSWTATQLAGKGGVTSGPQGTGSPSPILFAGATTIHVGYCDLSGNVWDVNGNGESWDVQQATGTNGLAGGPAAVGNPSLLSVDGGQILYCYFDADGNLHAGWSNYNFQGGWTTLQLAGGSGSATGAPAGEGNIATVFFQGQSFVFYRAKGTTQFSPSDIYLLWAANGSSDWSSMTIAAS